MNKLKPIIIIRVKIRGEIYDRVYSVKDIEHVVELFNQVHGNAMQIVIEEVQEEKVEADDR